MLRLCYGSKDRCQFMLVFNANFRDSSVNVYRLADSPTIGQCHDTNNKCFGSDAHQCCPCFWDFPSPSTGVDGRVLCGGIWIDICWFEYSTTRSFQPYHKHLFWFVPDSVCSANALV